MKDSLDRRIVTPDFLLKYFPSPNRFHELYKRPPESTLVVSEERYLHF